MPQCHVCLTRLTLRKGRPCAICRDDILFELTNDRRSRLLDVVRQANDSPANTTRFTSTGQAQARRKLYH